MDFEYFIFLEGAYLAFQRNSFYCLSIYIVFYEHRTIISGGMGRNVYKWREQSQEGGMESADIGIGSWWDWGRVGLGWTTRRACTKTVKVFSFSCFNSSSAVLLHEFQRASERCSQPLLTLVLFYYWWVMIEM